MRVSHPLDQQLLVKLSFTEQRTSHAKQVHFLQFEIHSLEMDSTKDFMHMMPCGGDDNSKKESKSGGGDGARSEVSPGAARAAMRPAGGVGRNGTYGREEITALRGIFDLYDVEKKGTIGVKELEAILQKMGHNAGKLPVASCVFTMVAS